MATDDLVKLWRSQDDGPAPDGGEVLMEVRRRAKKFDRTILWRDLREGAAALGMTVLAVVVAILSASPWLWIGGVVVSACCAAVYLPMHRTRVRHRSTPEDQPLDARLRAEIAKVGAQEELLRSVGRWYMRPLIVGAAVWMASIGLALPLPPPYRAVAVPLLAAIGAGILLATGRFVVWLNRQAADRHLAPLRAELEVLLAQVEAA
jgi:hypothetical protein